LRAIPKKNETGNVTQPPGLVLDIIEFFRGLLLALIREIVLSASEVAGLRKELSR
jgi:hypothetical protein